MPKPVLYVPALQVVHTDIPEVLAYNPAAQDVQVAGAVRPVPVEYIPAVHDATGWVAVYVSPRKLYSASTSAADNCLL
jgi:hypothetical protein